jgi:hypothetical protein
MSTHTCSECRGVFTTGGILSKGGYQCTNHRCGVHLCGRCTKGFTHATCPRCGCNAKALS